MKKTAVEWLVEELKKFHHPTEAMIMYAKKLEKEQIIQALKDSWNLAKHSNYDNPHAEQYYTETYKQD